MSEKVSIVGGDLRNVYLAEKLVNNNIEIVIYGIDKINIMNNLNLEIINKIYFSNNLLEAINFSNYIIGSIPFTKDGKYLNTPLFEDKILLEDFVSNIKSKKIILGKIDDEIRKQFYKENNIVLDLMANERLTIYNAIATVEGAIANMILNTKYTIFNSNILILGYGRIGKIMLNRLSSFSANIFCMARKDEARTYIESNGFKSVSLENLIEFLENEKIDYLVNTVPSLIIGREELEILKNKSQNVYLLDVASKPGGIDEKIAKELNLSYEMYLGIPRKNCTEICCRMDFFRNKRNFKIKK